MTALDPKKHLVCVAQSFVGVGEEGGDNEGAQVEEFQKAVDGVAQKEPWCVGFVARCVKKTEEETHIKSPVVWSESAVELWEKNPTLRRQSAEEGFIVLWKLKGTRKGHAGIVELPVKDGRFGSVEGNTSASKGDIEREGDVVARKSRSAQGSESFVLLGFVDPFPSV